jgi:hypothetical protein
MKNQAASKNGPSRSPARAPPEGKVLAQKSAKEREARKEPGSQARGAKQPASKEKASAARHDASKTAARKSQLPPAVEASRARSAQEAEAFQMLITGPGLGGGTLTFPSAGLQAPAPLGIDDMAGGVTRGLEELGGHFQRLFMGNHDEASSSYMPEGAVSSPIKTDSHVGKGGRSNESQSDGSPGSTSYEFWKNRILLKKKGLTAQQIRLQEIAAQDIKVETSRAKMLKETILGLAPPYSGLVGFIEAGSKESLENVDKFLRLSNSANDAGGILERISKFKRLGLSSRDGKRLYMGTSELAMYGNALKSAHPFPWPSVGADESIALFEGPIATAVGTDRDDPEGSWLEPSLRFNVADLRSRLTGEDSTYRERKLEPSMIEDGVRRAVEGILRYKSAHGLRIGHSVLESLMSRIYDKENKTFDEDRFYRLMDRIFHRESERGRSGIMPYQYALQLSMGLSPSEVGQLYGADVRYINAHKMILKSYLQDLYKDPVMRFDSSALMAHPPLVLGQAHLTNTPGLYLLPGSDASRLGVGSFFLSHPNVKPGTTKWASFVERLRFFEGGRVGLVNRNGNRFYVGTQVLIPWLTQGGIEGVPGQLKKLMSLGDTFLIHDGPVAKFPKLGKEQYAEEKGLSLEQVGTGLGLINKYPPAYSFSIADLYDWMGMEAPAKSTSQDVSEAENAVRSIVEHSVLSAAPHVSWPRPTRMLRNLARRKSGQPNPVLIDDLMDRLFRHPENATAGQLKEQQIVLADVMGLTTDETAFFHDTTKPKVSTYRAPFMRRLESHLVNKSLPEHVQSIVKRIGNERGPFVNAMKRYHSKWNDSSDRRTEVARGRDFLISIGGEHQLISGQDLQDPKVQARIFRQLELSGEDKRIVPLYKDGSLERDERKLPLVLKVEDWKKLLYSESPVSVSVPDWFNNPPIHRFLEQRNVSHFDKSDIEKALGPISKWVTEREGGTIVLTDIWRLPYKDTYQYVGNTKGSFVYRGAIEKIRRKAAAVAASKPFQKLDSVMGIDARDEESLWKMLQEKYGIGVHYIDGNLLEAVVLFDAGSKEIDPRLVNRGRKELRKYERLSHPVHVLPPPYEGWPIAPKPPLSELMPDDAELEKFYGNQADKLSPVQRRVLYADLVLRASPDEIAELLKMDKSSAYTRIHEARSRMGLAPVADA